MCSENRVSKACQKRKKSQIPTDFGQSVLKDDECLASFFKESKKIKDDTINKTASEIEIEKRKQRVC